MALSLLFAPWFSLSWRKQPCAFDGESSQMISHATEKDEESSKKGEIFCLACLNEKGNSSEFTSPSLPLHIT